MADVFAGVPPQPHEGTEIDGDKLLTQVYEFLGRFVIYPSEAAQIAHTLWIAHTYFMDSWESTPRIAFLSPEPGSGKSRALEVTEPLVLRPVHAVNTTPAYLFRKVSDEDGLPVILYDEVDTVFGPKAKDNEDIRGMINAGHRKGAVAGRCVVKGKTVTTEELPAYCALAMAGLDDLPDTIGSRAVIIRMRRRSPKEKVEPWRHRLHSPEGEEIQVLLADWAAESVDRLGWPEMPAGVEDRKADVWEALLAVADLAGGDWPEKVRVAAVADVADSKAGTPTLGVRLLTDLKQVFGNQTAMKTEDILWELNAMEDAPWAEIRKGQKPEDKRLDSRGLSRRLGKYGVKPKDVRIGEWHGKGYTYEDLHDSFDRYVPVTTVPDPEQQRVRVNTEDVINAEGSADTVGEAGYKSATSATTATGWGQCSKCGARFFSAGSPTCKPCTDRDGEGR